MRQAAAFVLCVAVLQLPAAARAETPRTAAPRAPTWAETKCVRYNAAWLELQKRRGLKDLGAEFVTRHQAFIDAGCRESTRVCPRSDAELEVADMMVIAAMNAGMASTFPPFSCRR